MVGANRAAPGAIEDRLDRGHFDAVAAVVLGAIEGVVGLRQQHGEVGDGVLTDHDADTHRAFDRPAVDLARGRGEASTDLFGDDLRPLARGVDQQCGEFLAAETAEQVHATDAARRHVGKNLQHAVADGVAEPVVDRFEMVEIEQHHRGRLRIVRLPGQLGFAVLQEARRLASPVSGSISAAVLWPCSPRSFAIASRMKAVAMVNSSASRLSTVSQTLANT